MAESAQLTTGAIYHYFGSKHELYAAAYAEVQALVYERFVEAADAVEPAFVAQVNAVLDEAVALNREDPSLARFLLAVRTDTARHVELGADERLAPLRRNSFFSDMIDLGIRNAEIREEDRDTVLDVISAVMMGLVSASSEDPETHARAVDGLKRLMTGVLVTPTP